MYNKHIDLTNNVELKSVKIISPGFRAGITLPYDNNIVYKEIRVGTNYYIESEWEDSEFQWTNDNLISRMPTIWFN